MSTLRVDEAVSPGNGHVGPQERHPLEIRWLLETPSGRRTQSDREREPVLSVTPDKNGAQSHSCGFKSYGPRYSNLSLCDWDTWSSRRISSMNVLCAQRQCNLMVQSLCSAVTLPGFKHH
jgi:hypothetical protein